MLGIEFGLKASVKRGPLAHAAKLGRLRSAHNFPHTAEAVKEATLEARKVLLRAIQGKAMPWSGGEIMVNRITGRLHGSILGGTKYPYKGNPLRGAIEIKVKHYRYIVDGVRPFDMKPGLLRSPKAKLSKRGIKYLVIAMPSDPKNRWSARVFRIVTSRSKGWIHPGTLPQRLDLYAREKVGQKHARRIRAAFKKDLGL